MKKIILAMISFGFGCFLLGVELGGKKWKTNKK